MNKEVIGIYLRAAAKACDAEKNPEKAIREKHLELVRQAKEDSGNTMGNVGFSDDNFTLRELATEVLEYALHLVKNLKAPEGDTVEDKVASGIIEGLDLRVIPKTPVSGLSMMEHILGVAALAAVLKSREWQDNDEKADKVPITRALMGLTKLMEGAIHKQLPTLLAHGVWSGVIPEIEPDENWDPVVVLMGPYASGSEEAKEYLSAHYHKYHSFEEAQERMKVLDKKREEVEREKGLGKKSGKDFLKAAEEGIEKNLAPGQHKEALRKLIEKWKNASKKKKE